VEPVTVVEVLVLATWTCANVFMSRRHAPRFYGAEKLMRATQRAKAVCDELAESLRQRAALLDKKQALLEEVSVAYEGRSVLLAHMEANQEELVRLRAEELAQEIVAKGPTAEMADRIGKMIADADTDDGGETVRLLLYALREEWPEQKWAQLVSKYSENPNRWSLFPETYGRRPRGTTK